MFKGVDEKLERAGYFLNNLKTLADDAGGITRILSGKSQDMRANLDGFFFEIISAKDFFLQGIINQYGITKVKATERKRLIKELEDHDLNDAAKVVRQIDKLLDVKNLRPEQKLRDDQDSWLWRLNNYRNSATHRELLRYWNIAEGPTIPVKAGEKPQFQIILDPETKIPTRVRRIDIPSVNYEFEEARTYLFADPEDPSKGRADIEVIPYCKQSLERMRKFLEKLYSELSI